MNMNMLASEAESTRPGLTDDIGRLEESLEKLSAVLALHESTLRPILMPTDEEVAKSETPPAGPAGISEIRGRVHRAIEQVQYLTNKLADLTERAL